MTRLFSSALAAYLVAGSISAIAGWTPGDIVCVTGASGVGPGVRPAVLVIRTSPLSVASVRVDSGITGDGAFDPFRNRVVLARTEPFGRKISLLDSDGSLSDLSYAGNQDALIVAPTGDARIYFLRPNKISYLDAAGVTRDVLNTSGPLAFVPARVWQRMYYDAPSNALFMGGSSGINAMITKLPLTPDGTRLASPPIDNNFVTANLTSPTVVGFSPGPGANVFIKIDDNSGNTAPRMLIMEPHSIDISAYAFSGYFGVGGEIAGCYSAALNRAVVIDSLGDNLRLYQPEQIGAGSVVSAPLISAPASSGENAVLFPITDSAGVCPGDFNLDGLVDDSDFIVFVQSYNILDCADPAMTPGCPADFNHDALVDDLDFIVFVAAYNTLVCP
ncbi:MAG: hypothetical protein JNK16_07195 [Phycisphaerales bacterium]|nr:hypothetical protein [Phycisphaerales bacterium]